LRVALPTSVSLISLRLRLLALSSFFSNAPAPPEIYPLSLHDALPISMTIESAGQLAITTPTGARDRHRAGAGADDLGLVVERERSEEHTSELQSLTNLVCRLLLEKKKKSHRRPRSRAHRYDAHHTHRG